MSLVPVDDLNAETPLSALALGVTPTDLAYVRSNFAPPILDDWQLRVEGVERIQLSLDDLTSMVPSSDLVTMECAGNGRATMDPLPEGTLWGFGAASTVQYTGVPLAALLERVGVPDGTVEVVFTGADSGEVAPGRTVSYERSLPVAKALDPSVLVAWEMGGERLTLDHGAPVRLVVPGWYGMASVKWLVAIQTVAEPFGGYYQSERYVYVGEAGVAEGAPVAEMRVRSLIGQPADGEEVTEPVEIAGTAWSGTGAIVAVAVSTDGGSSWEEAELTPPTAPHGATLWRLRWDPAPGSHVIVARATDVAGNTQPLQSVWNELGYGNNVAHRVTVTAAT